ncbi:MAG: GNAT family N-acetyltransferase [Actinocatenispora sp.]
MEPVELREDDLTLRPWQVGDVDALYAACQDPDIQRWTRIPSPYTRDDAYRFVTEYTPAAWADGTRAPMGVFDTDTGELLGSSGLVALDQSTGIAELGYWTAPGARGRSVAERAARVVTRWSFDRVGVHRLEWRAKAGNHASRLVALRLGVTMEGTVREPEPGIDIWAGALLPGELRADSPDDPTLARAAQQARTFSAEQPTVRAGTVLLRPPRVADVLDIVAACRDPDMVRYTTIPDPYEQADAEFFIRHAANLWRDGDGAIFAFEDEDGRYLGNLMLRLDQWPARLAEVGYSVAPWARGRGVASSALREVCRWAFGSLAVDRVEWRAFVTNAASRRVAEKAGFRIEGTERGRQMHRGNPVDTWYGALLAEDIDAAPPA